MIKVTLDNIFRLTVVNHNDAPTALYLLKNSEVVEKLPYSNFSTHVFNLRASGNYTVRWFKRLVDGSVERGQSKSIRFSGFSGMKVSSPDKEPVIALNGVNPYTIYAAKVLSLKFSVLGLIDPMVREEADEIFGFKILSPESIPQGTLVIRHSRNRIASDSSSTFTTLPGRTDILSQTLELFGIMELYRISNSLYKDGLLEGAKHIQGFIFSKFNCRIPYQAEIGEGTRIGIGGIGVVIHPGSVIGENCVIAQNVTLGGRAGGNGTPVVGDNVWISPRAKCLGGKIGSNVVVGANAVVINEVESNSVVAGVPARVVSRDMSKYKNYTGIK